MPVKVHEVRQSLGQTRSLRRGVQRVSHGVHDQLEEQVEGEKRRSCHVEKGSLGEQGRHLGVGHHEDRRRGQDSVHLISQNVSIVIVGRVQELLCSVYRGERKHCKRSSRNKSIKTLVDVNIVESRQRQRLPVVVRE